jgi:hypothetical protein
LAGEGIGVREGRAVRGNIRKGQCQRQDQRARAKSEAQSSLKARAVQVLTDLTQIRLLLFEQNRSIPMPFLVVMVFWLAIIFMSLSLFSRLNPTLIVALMVFGVRGDLPNPRNERAVLRPDANFERAAAQCARAAPSIIIQGSMLQRCLVLADFVAKVC